MNYYGYINVGHVEDCNRKRLERMLKDYDEQLYLTWNPAKRDGQGVWELRRRPTYKTVVSQGSYNGGELFTAEYVENQFTHHVMDIPVLKYDVLSRLHEMDAWRHDRMVEDMDYESERRDDQIKAKARAEAHYAVKQHRREFRELKEALASGQSLARLLKGFSLD